MQWYDQSSVFFLLSPFYHIANTNYICLRLCKHVGVDRKLKAINFSTNNLLTLTLILLKVTIYECISCTVSLFKYFNAEAALILMYVFMQGWIVICKGIMMEKC